MCKLALPLLALALAGCQANTLSGDTSVGLPASAKIAMTANTNENRVVGEDQANAATGGSVDNAISTASVKPVSDASIVESYVAPKPGTILTWRNNWSTLPPVVSYQISGVVKLGGHEYLKMTAVGGLKEKISAFYDTANFALKGDRDPGDKAMVTYKPVEERYRFPLKQGARWVTAWESYDHRKKEETKGGGVVEVVRFETLKLPAGEFRAVKVKLPTPPGMPAGMTHFIWFAPELGVTVKEQIGNGSMNWTQILESVKLPAS